MPTAQASENNVVHPLLKWDETELLGKGRFGQVFAGTLNGQKVAVKRIDTTGLDGDAMVTDREEIAMKQFDHPNVLKLLYSANEGKIRFFALELCLTTLGHYFKDKTGKYKEKVPSDIQALTQMASGLAYIHSQKFVHRDLSPGNVLIAESSVLKISDFGFCKPTTSSNSYSLTSGIKGTQHYMAPELLELWVDDNVSAECLAQLKGNASSDVFALGCLFYNYVTKGKHPFFDGKQSYDIMANIVSGTNFIEELGREHFAFSVVEGMIKSNPKERWGLDLVTRSLCDVSRSNDANSCV